MDYRLTIETSRPYFAEIPYYLWGTVNYDSEGDCKCPTDMNWTWLELTHRENGEGLQIRSEGNLWTVQGTDPGAARVACFLSERCAAPKSDPEPDGRVGDWDHSAGLVRAARVAKEFAMPRLAIFDSHLFWGSWKWIGWFATEFTWVGRWIMVSVLKGDARGVPLCIDWLKQGTCCPEQSAALRQALNQLTGNSFESDTEWAKWYEGGFLRKGAKAKYPDPDVDAWLKELKDEYGDSQPSAGGDGGPAPQP